MESFHKQDVINRCRWVNMKNPLCVRYHDEEWGVPEHSDKKLFEMLLLECFQAGLSWECILNKRDAFRKAFDNFDVEKISQYDNEKCRWLLTQPIVRNKLKIRACITNSRVFTQIQNEYGSFDAYIWGFTNRQTIFESFGIRSKSPLSDEISKNLKKRGMQFVGSTIIYAYLQAVGVYNAHSKDCDCYSNETLKLTPYPHGESNPGFQNENLTS